MHLAVVIIIKGRGKIEKEKEEENKEEEVVSARRTLINRCYQLLEGLAFGNEIKGG